MDAVRVVILGDNDCRPVIALTSVDNGRLYALRLPNRQKIEVYDSTSFKKLESLKVAGLKDDSGLASCATNNCLYVNDYNMHTIYTLD
jgi:hypothetical protein